MELTEREASRNMRIWNWLSPPDPWEIYDFARKTPHRGPATWFTQGEVFQKWKTEGSLLWVNGIRTRLSFPFFPTADSFPCLKPAQERLSCRMCD